MLRLFNRDNRQRQPDFVMRLVAWVSLGAAHGVSVVKSKKHNKDTSAATRKVEVAEEQLYCEVTQEDIGQFSFQATSHLPAEPSEPYLHHP